MVKRLDLFGRLMGFFFFFENWVFYGNNNLSKKKVINSQLWKRDKFHLKWEDIYIYIYIYEVLILIY
jgi:hypothetical protein